VVCLQFGIQNFPAQRYATSARCADRILSAKLQPRKLRMPPADTCVLLTSDELIHASSNEVDNQRAGLTRSDSWVALGPVEKCLSGNQPLVASKGRDRQTLIKLRVFRSSKRMCCRGVAVAIPDTSLESEE
jgi:hypothetical protein